MITGQFSEKHFSFNQGRSGIGDPYDVLWIGDHHLVEAARSRVKTIDPFRKTVTVPVDWLTVMAIASVCAVIAAAVWCLAPKPEGRPGGIDFGNRYDPALKTVPSP